MRLIALSRVRLARRPRAPAPAAAATKPIPCRATCGRWLLLLTALMLCPAISLMLGAQHKGSDVQQAQVRGGAQSLCEHVCVRYTCMLAAEPWVAAERL